MFRMALSASFNSPSPSTSYIFEMEDIFLRIGDALLPLDGGGGFNGASLLFVDGMDDSISVVVVVVDDSGSFCMEVIVVVVLFDLID